MIKKTFLLLQIIPFCVLISCKQKYSPLSVHPDNPHYFLFRGRPTILIGSTEHYGAVLNIEFDYIRYLDELADKGLNVTRTFSGIYLEPQGAFGITRNTLAPGYEKLICPWARSDKPGYPGGGNKFDLTRWDERYFARLKDFISEAGKRKIVIELDLFSNFYDTLQWKLSPLYFENNINNSEPVFDQKEVLSLRHPVLLKLQEEMVKKILSECNSYDNIYYEVCNEPYFGDLQALDTWEEHMTNFVAVVENELPNKHLISQNIQNGYLKIENPNPYVSLFNFHYAKPPVTVGMNYMLNKPIGDNETGFNGIEDIHYRTEAWDFLTAGGALYNNLDYSFTADNEDGSFVVAKGQPGGGGITLRNQLKTLKQLFDELDFIKMKPINNLLPDSLEDGSTIRVLAEEGKQYLIYINRYKAVLKSDSEEARSAGTEFNLSFELPSGTYNATWIDPISGERTNLKISGHPGGKFDIKTPTVKEDIAFKLSKTI